MKPFLIRNWPLLVGLALMATTVVYLSLRCEKHQVEWWAKQPEGGK